MGRQEVVRTSTVGARWKEDKLLEQQSAPLSLFLLRRKHLAPYPLLHRPQRYLDLDPILRWLPSPPSPLSPLLRDCPSVLIVVRTWAIKPVVVVVD